LILLFGDKSKRLETGVNGTFCGLAASSMPAGRTKGEMPPDHMPVDHRQPKMGGERYGLEIITGFLLTY
jgi:hypothetical protein